MTTTTTTKSKPTIAELIERFEKRGKNAPAASSGTAGQLSLPIEELLDPGNGSTQAYPTTLTRIPIFAPYERGGRRAGDTDWIRGDVHQTAWGKITRFGPGLDTYDEDTLLGLLHTAQQKRITGKRRDLPIPAPRLVVDEFGTRRDGLDDEAVVHVGETSAYAINKHLGRPLGGQQLAACRDSLRRISLTQLIIHRQDLQLEGKIHLFDYLSKTDDFKGSFLIQFSPAMVQLLKEYTFIDMNVRMQLSDIGKGLHKFLSGQLVGRSSYSITLIKLQAAIGYQGEMKDFKRYISRELDKLIKIGWLSSAEITGTGRRTPFKLSVMR